MMAAEKNYRGPAGSLRIVLHRITLHRIHRPAPPNSLESTHKLEATEGGARWIYKVILSAT